MNLKYNTIKEIESEIKCPYCGHIWDESYEVVTNENIEEILECPECAKKFTVEKCITIDYRTAMDCELNEEQHDYKESSYSPTMETCSKCEMTRSKPELPNSVKAPNPKGKE